MASAPMGRMLTCIDKAVLQGGGELSESPEVFIIARAFVSQYAVKCVVKIVTPLRVYSVSAFCGRRDDPAIVEVALRDQQDGASEPFCFCMDQVRKFFQDVHGAEIVDAVYGVQPQSVDMILRDPVQRIVEDEAADLVAVRSS